MSLTDRIKMMMMMMMMIMKMLTVKMLTVMIIIINLNSQEILNLIFFLQEIKAIERKIKEGGEGCFRAVRGEGKC